MELEQALNETSHNYPFFPVALSVVEEKTKDENDLEPKVKGFQHQLEKKVDKRNIKEDDQEVTGSLEPGKVNYSFNELIGTQNLYGAQGVPVISNYTEKTGTSARSEEPEEEDHPATVIVGEKESAEMLEPLEAKETMETIQYAFMLGTTTSQVSNEDLRKLNLWIMQNPAYFQLFERTALTRDVNYR